LTFHNITSQFGLSSVDSQGEQKLDSGLDGEKKPDSKNGPCNTSEAALDFRERHSVFLT